MFRLKRFLVAFSVTGMLCLPTDTSAQQVHAEKPITIEQLIDIKHPSSPVSSPDGRQIAFIWDRAGVSNVYVSDLDGRARPTAATTYSDGRISNVFFSNDGQTIYFARDGDLWQLPPSGGEPRRALSTPLQDGDFSPSPDRTRIAVVRKTGAGHGSDLVVLTLSTGAETRIAHDDVNIDNPEWSPDGSQICYIGGAKFPFLMIRLPHTLVKSSYSPIPNMSQGCFTLCRLLAARQLPSARKVTMTRSLGLTLIALSSPASQTNTRLALFMSQIQRTASRNRSTKTTKRNFGVSPTGRREPNRNLPPDGRWVAYLSDQDGWDHIYVIPSAGGTPVQITKGHFEAWRPASSHDSTRIAFDANEPDHPGDRRVGVAAIGADPATPPSPISPTQTGPTSSRCGHATTNASSINIPIHGTRPISTSSTQSRMQSPCV